MNDALNNGVAGELFEFPASLGQERFWRLDRLKPGNPTWSVPVRFRLQGVLNLPLVERAFNAIVQRHEALRTTFNLVEGQLVQIVKASVQIHIPISDLRSLSKPDRDAAVDRLSFEEARRRFDLNAGPLFRVSMLRVADDEHVLLVTPHHSVTDYWSIGLISNELGALYEAYTRGIEPALPDLQVQYGDFSVWQQEQLNSGLVQNELAFWDNQLKDLPLLEILTDHPRPPSPTFEATITSLLLPTELTDALKEIANREGATFFNTTLAALAILLNQYTGQTDFGVATQVAGRNSVELEPLIGVFINNIVLRVDLTGDPTFSQLLNRTQEVGLQSLANQNVRFEQVLRKLRPADYPSHHTLFRINFICQRDPVKPLEFSGIKLTVIPSKSQGALYDLNVFLVLRTEGWRLACEYNTDLFEASTINQLLIDYRQLLEYIVDNSDRHVSEFRSSEGASRRRMGKTTVAAPTPSAPVMAVAAPYQDVGEKTSASRIPLQETSAQTDALSEGPAERYAMPSSAAQRRFWVLEELTPGNPALHMRACVRLTGSLSAPILQQSLQYLVDRHETLRTTFEQSDAEIMQVIAPPPQVFLASVSIEEIAGVDRETQLWQAIRREASVPFDLKRGPLMRARLFRLHAQDHVLVISTHHIITDGWSQNVIQRELWAIYESLVDDHAPSLPPLTVQYGDFVDWQHKWLDSNEASAQIDYWTKQLAAPLPVLELPTAQSSKSRTAVQEPMQTVLLPESLTRSLKDLSQSYDASMFMVMLTAYAALLNRWTGQEDILIGSPIANRRPETESLIGPFAGPVTLRLNLKGDPTLRELLRRVREVTLDALSHADLPFEVLVENLHVPSIRGRNPLSQCYFFYQKAFLQPCELHDLTVTPLPDFGLGTHFELQMGLLERREGIRAQLEYNPGLFRPGTIQSILSRYETVLEALATNPDLRLSDLPLEAERLEPGRAATEVQAISALPQDETEVSLTRIWEDILGRRPIGRSQNYFELGGSSLLAVRLFAEIERAFNIKLPLSTLIEAQTIERLAHILRREPDASDWSPLVQLQEGGERPPFFCIHGAGGNVLIYRELVSHLGSDQAVYGLQSQGLDGERPILTKIEDMAALYVAEVQRVQPRGPYFLGGYCMGGTIALEMAQQLKARREEVALVALFDTMNWSRVPPHSVWSSISHQIQRLVFHAGNFLLLNFNDKLTFLREKFKVLRSRTTVWRGMLLGYFTDGRSSRPSESLVLAKLWKTNDEAILNYVPRRYPGVITDFRPVKQYARYAGTDLKWGHLAHGEQVVTLPVYPTGMLLEPFVKHLAAALSTSIDRALFEATSAPTETQSVQPSRLGRPLDELRLPFGGKHSTTASITSVPPPPTRALATK
jgi:non-ribosomal peptide synthetase component F